MCSRDHVSRVQVVHPPHAQGELYLTKELNDRYWAMQNTKNAVAVTFPPTVSMVCRDGSVAWDAVVLAAASVLMRDVLQQEMIRGQDEYVIHVPSCSVSDARSLVQIFYTGRTAVVEDHDGRGRQEQGLRALANLLCIETMDIVAIENKEEEGTFKMDMANEDEEAVRRSERPRKKNRRYESTRDFEAEVEDLPKRIISTGGGGPLQRVKTASKKPKRPTAGSYLEIPVTEDLVRSIEKRSARTENLPAESRPVWQDNFDGDAAYKLCYVCEEAMVGLHVLTKHLRTHSEGKFACPSCRKISTSGLALHDHMRAHYKNLIEDGDAENSENLRRRPTREKALPGSGIHRLRLPTGVRTNTSREYTCVESECCAQTVMRFSSALAFSRHMIGVHGKKPFDCEICGVRYNKKLHLDEHLASRHSDGVPKIPCDICGKRFFSISRLQYHRRDQHETKPEEKTAKCTVCGFVSSGGVRNLRKHMETHREDSYRKFQCSHCSRMFRRRTNLTVHERTHTGEAPYKCELCDINFKRMHHLTAHLKTLNHSNRVKLMEAEGVALPDRVFSIDFDGKKEPRKEKNKRSSAAATSKGAKDPQQAQLKRQREQQAASGQQLAQHGFEVFAPPEHIYMEVTDLETATAVEMAADLQSTVLLTTTTDTGDGGNATEGGAQAAYQQFIID